MQGAHCGGSQEMSPASSFRKSPRFHGADRGQHQPPRGARPLQRWSGDRGTLPPGLRCAAAPKEVSVSTKGQGAQFKSKHLKEETQRPQVQRRLHRRHAALPPASKRFWKPHTCARTAGRGRRAGAPRGGAIPQRGALAPGAKHSPSSVGHDDPRSALLISDTVRF